MSLLTALRACGAIDALDHRFALAVCRLGGVDDERVAVAAALACRAPRQGHVGVSLALASPMLRAELEPEAVIPALPEATDWEQVVVACKALVRAPEEDRAAPLVWADGILYLERFWDYQRRLATAVISRLAPVPVDDQWLEGALDRLFPADPRTTLQRRAVALAARHPLALIVGGPGTGKTAVVVKLLALLVEEAREAGRTPPRVVLVAPTGKAAARLTESVRENAERWLAPEEAAAVVVAATTLHRRLGLRPGTAEARHDADDPLMADVVVVDEASMVDLPTMTKLVKAVPPAARLVLLGDPDQLVSVELGAVLGDLCVAEGALGQATARLTHTWRYAPDSGIGVLAEAIRRGDADAAVEALSSRPDLTWHRDGPTGAVLERLLGQAVLEGYGPVFAAPEPASALTALRRFRILCAHRHGSSGVEGVHRVARRALVDAGLAPTAATYRGLPLMVTRNDPELGVWNGDAGVLSPDPAAAGGLRLWLETERGGLRSLSPALLPGHEVVYATTVHKAQGSEYDHVWVVLPDRPSPLLTRELLYTAITRAKARVTLVGTEEHVRAAVATSTRRMSGLGGMLSG